MSVPAQETGKKWRRNQTRMARQSNSRGCGSGYANSIRYASAMAGPDYAAFKNGWWELTNNLQRMHKTVRAAKKP